VHVFAPELAAATSPSLSERSRYIGAHWAHGPSWVEHEVDGDSWLGFDRVRLAHLAVRIMPDSREPAEELDAAGLSAHRIAETARRLLDGGETPEQCVRPRPDYDGARS